MHKALVDNEFLEFKLILFSIKIKKNLFFFFWLFLLENKLNLKDLIIYSLNFYDLNCI